jgi:hypothetical protein
MAYWEYHWNNADAKVDLQRDFVWPCLLTMAVVGVLAMQTRGFVHSDIKPLIPWPQASTAPLPRRRVKSNTSNSKEKSKDKSKTRAKQE